MRIVSWEELKSIFRKHYAEHAAEGKFLTGYVTFTEDSFEKLYSVDSRTYKFTSDNKMFRDCAGYSLFGDALDGSDNGVRLDYYMHDERHEWGDWRIEMAYYNEEDE